MSFHMQEQKPAGDWRLRTIATTIFTVAILIFIIVTRWWLAPQHLYYFDSVNFALALDQFNPALHQPQPPGYPLFVGLAQLIHFWVARPEQVFLIAGILGACAAVLLIRKLTSEMFGSVAGLLAAALLASNPVFWFGGITNEVRVFLALSSVAVALLSWMAYTRPAHGGWLVAAFAALGIGAGFRPAEATLLIPMLLWVWYQTGRRALRLLLACICLAAATAPWLIYTVAVSGGPTAYLHLLWHYSGVQFHDSSAVFGAQSNAAWHMVAQAVTWNVLGAVIWLWALPMVRSTAHGVEFRRKAVFLAIWFFPAFLFSALIHIGDPDQALTSIPVLSMIGAGVLAAVLAKCSSRRVYAMAGAAVAAHVVLFFVPPTHIAKASSYKAAAMVDRITNSTLDAIDQLRLQRPATILYSGASVSWRQIVYYFPDDYVVVMPPEVDQPWTFYHRARVYTKPGRGLLRDGSRRVVWLLPPLVKPAPLPGVQWRQRGSVYYFDFAQGASLTVGQYKLIPASFDAPSPHSASFHLSAIFPGRDQPAGAE
ncbi:MAG TPA: glycosyltransferase family 39 protein [Bryobacteraceae bacterium]|nr:glycosyltransferase family 39 protein [Bryobacteraceae bacterium]